MKTEVSSCCLLSEFRWIQYKTDTEQTMVVRWRSTKKGNSFRALVNEYQTMSKDKLQSTHKLKKTNSTGK